MHTNLKCPTCGQSFPWESFTTGCPMCKEVECEEE